MILICGRSRAGKTTYSKQFENVIHQDSFYGNLLERYQQVCDRVTDDSVVDGIFHTAESRKMLLSKCNNAHNTCIYVDTPLNVIALRMTHGKTDDISRVIPTDFEQPTYEEGWDEIITVKGDSTC